MSRYIFAFNLDGTLTKKKILPEIAEKIGLASEMKQLTQKNNQPLISFHESFRQCIELLKKIPIQSIRNIINAIPLHQEMLSFMRNHKENTCIITNHLDIWLSELAERIGIRIYSSQSTLSHDFVAGIQYSMPTLDVINSFTKPFVYIGEGLHDAEIMKAADIGIVYGGIYFPKNSVLTHTNYAIFQEKKLCYLLNQLL